MESIFFRRLEPRRSTQTLVPFNGLTSVGGFRNINPSAGLMPLDMMNPQYTTQAYTGPNYGRILGSCPKIDSPGFQSVVGTLGDIFSGGSSLYNVGQYNVGTYNWGGYNLGVGNIMGSCPKIDSPGLQSIVGTLGNIFTGGRSFGQPSTYSSAFDFSRTCYDYGWTPGCSFFIGGGGCKYIFEPCSYIGGGCGYIVEPCSYIAGPCSYIGGGCFDFGYCPSFGGCMVMDPAPFSSIIGTFNSFQQY